jgi:hypothetical protein
VHGPRGAVDKIAKGARMHPQAINCPLLYVRDS